MAATIGKSLNAHKKQSRGDAKRTTGNMNHGISPHPPSTLGGSTQERSPPSFGILTPKEAAAWLRVSQSFLAKARMRNTGPPFIAIGRAIRYCEADLIRWIRSQSSTGSNDLGPS
jgi:Helix-turn-helix domain